ncbi:MAG TPA: hypothetical protein VGJ73_03970, partial [Verrucomicrobiae bacterium]
NYNDDVVRSDWQVVLLSSLRGTNATGHFRLLTNHSLSRGHKYLVLGYYIDGDYEAFEDYRVVPLSHDFDVKSLSNKPLNQQLQILFQDSVKEMNQEIQDDEAERQRLKEALRN